MTETPEERARRLGLTSETPDERATRLGLVESSPRDVLKLDVRVPAESTFGLPYDPSRPGDLEALKSAPAGLKTIAPDAARGASALALSAAQAIPGMEAFEAAMGSAGSKLTDAPITFRESRDALRSETNKIPKEVRMASQVMAGGGVAKALPMLSPAKAGAAFAAADQVLSADDMSLEDRLLRTGAGGAGGAVIGKTLDALITGVRGAAAKPFDKNLAQRRTSMGAADNVNYGAAATEMTTGGGTHPAIKSALMDPTVAPFTKAVRATQQFANADDATVLREVYKLMGERQRGLGTRLLNSEDFKAGSKLEKDEIEGAKKLLLTAADNLGPRFRKAVQQHAITEGEIRALKHGQSAGSQVIGSRTPKSEKAIQRGPDALRKKVPGMTIEERLAAEEGILGELKAGIGIQPNLPSLGGVLTTAIRPMRAATLMRDLKTPNTVLLDDLIRAGLLTSTTAVP